MHRHVERVLPAPTSCITIKFLLHFEFFTITFCILSFLLWTAFSKSTWFPASQACGTTRCGTAGFLAALM